jgi:hypothetical protein
MNPKFLLEANGLKSTILTTWPQNVIKLIGEQMNVLIKTVPHLDLNSIAEKTSTPCPHKTMIQVVLYKLAINDTLTVWTFFKPILKNLSGSYSTNF